jgi:acetylornithine deacetylase/succinyl-diaminopimelate desuccinylase-like protein
MSDSRAPDLGADAVALTRGLLQIDSSNYGDDSGPGERAAAEFAADQLTAVGMAAELYTTTSDRRAGVTALIEGTDKNLPPLLLTGHLDVVPAVPDEWTHPPFAGFIDDDEVLWGRGAVDMKDMVGMSLAVLRHWHLTGYRPRRSIALLLTPDEEAGGAHGAHWIVEHRPDLLRGATEAVGEVGGFSVTLPNGRRIYPIQTGEKGLAWITATLAGTAGHGSLINPDNPVTRLTTGLAALLEHPFGVQLTPTMETFVSMVSDIVGEPLTLDDQDALTAQIGGLSAVVGASVRTTVNPTMLQAGFKHNVIPSSASMGMDVRFLPGEEQRVLDRISKFLPAEVELSYANRDISLETGFDGTVVEAMVAALAAHDPDGVAVPYVMTGGTDGKAFSGAGVRYLGFSPLRLEPDLPFWGMFHAPDERVPLAALKFGASVLDDFLRRL